MAPVRGRFWYAASGLSNVWLSELDYRACPVCQRIEYSVPELRSLTRKLVEAVIFKCTLLRGEEVRFLRRQLGVTREDVAFLLCLTAEALDCVEEGSMPISPLADQMLRVIAAQQCLRWRYPLVRLRAIDVTRSDATRVLLRLTGRKWQMVSM